MNIGFSILTLSFAVLGVTLGTGCAGAEEQTPQAVRPEASQVTEASRARIDAVGDALGSAGWLRPEARYVAPAVDRTLLEQADSVTHAGRACTAVTIADSLWGKCDWNWRFARRRDEATAAADATTRRRQIEVQGDLSVEAVLAPSAGAAQDYLLAALADNMLPTDLLVARLEAAQRPTELGDTAILIESTDGTDTRIRFVRNNVYVAVRGHGDFASEALSVARSIDGRIVTQQPLTYEGLIARRPTVTLETPSADDLRYELALSPGQRLADVHARVDGQRVAVSGRQVPLSAEQKQAGVEVVVIGEDLLVGVAATED